jgi:hypothetical protein
VAHVFIMEWAAILRDLVLGLLTAGAIGAWVPEGFWQGFFLTGHPVLSVLWGPIVGPLVAIVSFVCSIGNVLLAAVLWNGGISFGGADSYSAVSEGDGSRRHMKLHHLAQHRLPHPCNHACHSLRAHRRNRHAENNGRLTRRSGRAQPLVPPQRGI